MSAKDIGGDWRLYVNEEEGLHILTEPGGTIICEQIMEDAAPVIVAAPDMLAALKDAAYGIRYCYEHGIEDSMAWETYVSAMEAAIAKAEGR